MKALLKSHNLIGDGLCVGPAAKRWYETFGHQFEQIDMWVLKNHSTSIYEGMGVPWNIVHEADPTEYNTFIDFNVSEAFQISDKQKIHLIEAYGQMAGVNMAGVPLRPNYQPPEIEVPRELQGLVLVSMFSMSCACRENPPKPPNKMLPWAKWIPLLDTLRKEFPDSKIKFLGAPEDKVEKALAGLMGISDDEYLLGIPMPYLANIMKHAKCLVTVDNGMGHLAASQCVNQFLLAPAVLSLHYIVPWGNPNLRLVHVDPPNVNPASINWALKSAIKDWKEKEI